jgi:hypothetical protein
MVLVAAVEELDHHQLVLEVDHLVLEEMVEKRQAIHQPMQLVERHLLVVVAVVVVQIMVVVVVVLVGL